MFNSDLVIYVVVQINTIEMDISGKNVDGGDLVNILRL